MPCSRCCARRWRGDRQRSIRRERPCLSGKVALHPKKRKVVHSAFLFLWARIARAERAKPAKNAQTRFSINPGNHATSQCGEKSRTCATCACFAWQYSRKQACMEARILSAVAPNFRDTCSVSPQRLALFGVRWGLSSGPQTRGPGRVACRGCPNVARMMRLRSGGDRAVDSSRYCRSRLGT